MAIKYTSAEIAKNSVKVKPRTSPPKPKTPAAKPTMRSTAKDKPMTAKASAAGNKRGLAAANKPSTSSSADSARFKAIERAINTAPNKRTAAQKLAISRLPKRGGSSAVISRMGSFGGGMNWQNK